MKLWVHVVVDMILKIYESTISILINIRSTFTYIYISDDFDWIIMKQK